MELAKSFEPAEIERRWYPDWESRGYFDAGLDTSNTNAFCILLPPPNVTGTLHMGHGFNQTLMDALTRYHRMRGDNTLWQPGTDHAGIATQIVVERQLDAQGVSRHELGREKFLEKVWEWKEYSGGSITGQMRRLGTSPDWKRERFTMDAGLSTTVTETFVRLFNEGLIYRGKRLVNWDPKLGTAVSDLEVVQEEEDGKLWHIRYPFTDGPIGELTGLTVATTRPETMLGDVAVMVHPEDERYTHLIGKTVRLPLTERDIPIIADDYVDREFGTGCVKVTPAHDFNDYAVGQRHGLDMIVILNLDGTVPASAEVYDTRGAAKQSEPLPTNVAGLDRFAASSSFAPDDCSPGFALSGLPLTGRAVVSDDVDYRAFETRIDTGPAGPTNDSTPTFTFSSSPPGSSFECKVDSESFRACSGPGRSDTAPALSDGLHTFTVRALDSGSNPDPSPATQEFTVDTAPPDTAIDSGPAGITNDATASFTFSSGEPGTRFLCRFDEAGSWNPCESPTVWTDYSELPDGPHTFAVQSIDAASNADPTPATRDFTLDTAVPVITITRQPKRRIKTTRRSRRVKVSFRSEAGSAFECRLDKAAFEPCASPYRVNARSRPGEGREHTISIRATDRAGNSTAPTAVRFRLTRRH